MPEYLPVRALTRSQKVRINNQHVKTYITSYVDLEDPKRRKELNDHMTVGAVVVVGAVTNTLPATVTSGLGVTAVSPYTSKSVKQAEGYIRTESTSAIVTVASNTFAIEAAAANPRIDIVEVKNDGSEVKVKKGTEGSSPTAPTVDSGFTVLAEVSVAKEFTEVKPENLTAKRTLQ